MREPFTAEEGSSTLLRICSVAIPLVALLNAVALGYAWRAHQEANAVLDHIDHIRDETAAAYRDAEQFRDAAKRRLSHAFVLPDGSALPPVHAQPAPTPNTGTPPHSRNDTRDL